MNKHKPEWLKIRPPYGKFIELRNTIKNELHTVCQEAHCPNIYECWSKGTATFMIMSNLCTRTCKFCAVKKGHENIDIHEPDRIADAVKKLKIKYAVITTVCRDDLPDQGAGHIAACIKAAKEYTKVEILIPDFRGDIYALRTVVEAEPDVLGHNIEVVKSLQHIRDPRAGYEQSLNVLKNAKKFGAKYTKSSIMLGLGETKKEIRNTMKDLRNAGVDILTLGQYLQPSPEYYPVKEYVHPTIFNELKEEGLKMGFLYVASGPFVRSSYKAGDVFRIVEKS